MATHCFHAVSLFLIIVSPSVLPVEGAGPVSTLAYLVSKKIKDGAVETIKSTGSDEAVRYFADILMSTVMTSCLRLLPNTIDIPPLDLNINMGGPGHLVADRGKIKGLNTATARQIRYAIDDNENLLISMPFTFTDLHVIYDRFVFDCWPLKMTGNADMKFIDNTVIINLTLIKITELISKIAGRDCVFHMRSVTFEGFEQIEPIIKMDSEVGNHEFLANHVFPVVAADVKKVLLEIIDVKMTNSLYNALPASSAWICRDNNVKQLILQNSGPVSFTPEGAASWLSDNVESNVKHLVSNLKDVTTSKIGQVRKNIQEFNIDDSGNNDEAGNFWIPAYPKSIKTIVGTPKATAGVLINSLQENIEGLPSWLVKNRGLQSWLRDSKTGATSWLSNKLPPSEPVTNVNDPWTDDVQEVKEEIPTSDELINSEEFKIPEDIPPLIY